MKQMFSHIEQWESSHLILKCPLKAYAVDVLIPVCEAILGYSGNYGRWSLASGSWSLHVGSWVYVIPNHFLSQSLLLSLQCYEQTLQHACPITNLTAPILTMMGLNYKPKYNLKLFRYFVPNYTKVTNAVIHAIIYEKQKERLFEPHKCFNCLTWMHYLNCCIREGESKQWIYTRAQGELSSYEWKTVLKRRGCIDAYSLRNWQ